MSSLFWFRPIFVLLLFLAEGMFCIKLRRRRGFAWRLPVAVAVSVGLAFAIPYKVDSSIYCAFMFIVLFALTVATGFFVFEEPAKSIMFASIAGYTIQHIASEFCELFNSIMTSFSDYSLDIYDIYKPVEVDKSSIYIITAYMVLYVWVYLSAMKLCVPRVEKNKIMQTSSWIIVGLSALITIVDVIVSSVITYVLPADVLAPLGRGTGFTVQLLLHMYNILCCLLAIILIIELPRRSGAENELKLIRQLNRSKRDQYETAKQNIELINMKCHDLKHRALMRFGDRADEQELNEINEAIDIFDSSYKTANEALNVVLMEKSLICKHENINLSVIADASKLGFMRDTDIYVLFGNILDNAIEAVRKVKDGRTIGINIRIANSFLIINTFNVYEGELKMINGLPATTKSDQRNHGYGLKSVRYIVDKYNGEMSLSAKDNMFNLTIMFTDF